MAAENDRQTSMQFCPECNNLMYPKEKLNEDNPKASTLVYVCKAVNCTHCSDNAGQRPEAQSRMVWKHLVKHQMMANEIVHTDITQDPTLPRTRNIVCEKCRNREAVYIQHLTGPSEGGLRESRNEWEPWDIQCPMETLYVMCVKDRRTIRSRQKNHQHHVQATTSSTIRDVARSNGT